MRVIEASAGGVVAAIAGVLIADRLHIPDLVLAGAIPFLIAFLAVLLRPDRSAEMFRRR